ncbi:MAG: hypothetical protein EOP53_20890 [Sphingobacteriales bacterium]|nr:MAG: hypothetical protein EOP53_20890 [Sphingobacteriales bacterium]
MLIADDILAGIVKGILRRKPGIPVYKSISHRINQSIFNTLHIWKGLFIGPLSIVLSRLSWEIIQTLVGFFTSHFSNLFRDVQAVKYVESVTVLEGGGMGGSVSFGSYILLFPGFPAQVGHYLFMHEFGHSLQSRESGPLYLFKYGVPSLLTDNFAWMEKEANLRSILYFPQHKNALIRDDKTPPAKELNHAKWWEYLLLFLGIGIIIIPYLNTEKAHLRNPKNNN